MKYGLMLLLLLTSISSIPIPAAAQDSCPYCGIWIPFSGGSSYSSKDRLTVTEETVALPGCSSTKSTQIIFTDKSGDYTPPEDTLVKPVKAIVRIEQSISCTPTLPGLSQGTLVEIKIRPRGYENSEELELVLFAPTALEELKASYAHELIPTPPGQKQMMKRPARPLELGGWWFIREGYDPCAEGAARGSWICSAIKHKKADENLNAEWKRLLTLIAPKAKPNIISIQNKWLKACSSKCAKEGVDMGYHPWGLAYETFCLAEEKEDRSQKLRALYDCMSVGKRNCPQLKMKP